MKFLIVLCLSVLVAQGNAQWPDPDDEDFDYVIRLLSELEAEVASQVRSATEKFREALTSIEELSTGILDDLSKEFDETTGPLVNAISSLETEGAERGIDVSECTDGSIDSINDLPKELLGITAQCLSDDLLIAEGVVNQAYNQINISVSTVDQYWTRIEECAERTSTQREICVKELESEVGRDSEDIPDIIGLVAEGALDYLNSLKPDLLVCTSGRVNYLVEIGEAIVKNVTACVESIFNPTTTTTTTTAAPTTAPPTTPTEAPTTVTTEAPTTIPPLTTTEAPTTITTDAPTTVPPATTTESPTTITTDSPTTASPATTTEAPTTITTDAPTTASPATTTEAPTTITITTEAPTTIPPETTTEVPTTVVPN